MNHPTVVLVHGGFADASFLTPVVKTLQARNLPVLAPPNPLRSPCSDDWSTIRAAQPPMVFVMASPWR
jgi:hypothetical protein